MKINLGIKDDFVDSESRCGKKCSECSHREEYGCAGCKNITDGYWGSKCELKECCEGRYLDHCGLCGEFPCKLIREFSYDKDTGDDGERLLNCKEWLDKRTVSKEKRYGNLLLGASLGIIIGIIAGAYYNMTAAFVVVGLIAGVGIALMIETSKRK